MKNKLKKTLISSVPYVFIALFATKFGQTWRLADGITVSEKFLHIADGFAEAMQSPLPSLYPLDWLVGVMVALIIRLIVYEKSKNAKKYRRNVEYGSARWGKAEDIAPYIDPDFRNNVILTQTERLTMNNRPKDPKTARNKNVLVVGGSGSGKTRFFVKPQIMQMHSSYVVTDPKGGLLCETGKMLQKNWYKIKVLNTINFKKSMHYNPFSYIHSEKDVLFLIMSDTDDSFNFLISMCYTQLFNLLCEKADDVYGGRLPIHVRCLIDECANIGQIPKLEKLVATIRSREISACLVLQAQSQLKAVYKDNADTIIGNCDSRLFLGGSEPTTLKELSASLGKETIDIANTGESRGKEVSHSLNYQKLGKDLASVDELSVLDGGKCILQLRGVRPFLSDKYDITKHPNYKYLSDYDPRNNFDIEKFLSTRLKTKANDTYDAYEITETAD